VTAVSQMRDGRGGDRRRGRPRYSYNAGRAGVVGGTGYPTRRAGVIVFLLVTGHRTILVRRSSIQGDVVACIRDHLSNLLLQLQSQASIWRRLSSPNSPIRRQNPGDLTNEQSTHTGRQNGGLRPPPPVMAPTPTLPGCGSGPK
jgi:hypothetical protein